MKKPFTQTNLRHEILNKWFRSLLAVILTMMSVASNILAAENTELQQRSITGTVTEASTDTPMPGVNIVLKGTSNGTLTDINGKYTIAIPDENAVLVFSFIGYNTFEQPVSGRSVINISLTSVTQSLDEVIVVGYGTQKKSDLTGSVVRVSMEEKASLANMNLSQALSGTSAGVNIQGSGAAGGEPDLSIRGRTSLSANDKPLIVLDGIIYNGSISDISVSDIETIDILKDASAAAVYGSRSANGVLLITTKKGKTDKPVISANAYYGYQDMTNNPMKIMNAEQYAIRLVDYYYQQNLYNWYKTGPTSDEGKPVRPDISDRNAVALRLRSKEESDNYLAGNEIDWVDEVTQLAPIQNYNINLSGRNGGTNYFVSGSYTNEEGILINDKFKRFTLHSKVENDVTKWLNVGLITSYSFRDYSGLEASLDDARVATPLADNHIGSLIFDSQLTGEGYMPYPLQDIYVDNKNCFNNLFLVGTAKVSVPWIKGLTYEFNYSNTFITGHNNTFQPLITSSGASNRGLAEKYHSEERNWIVNNIITYLRTFENHQINATLLYSRENRNFQSSTLNAKQFDNPTLGYNNMGLGTIATVGSSAWDENSLSYMARFNYSFKNRYLLTATVRRDGFSGFGKNRKFATFPSVSLGWVASEESFLRDIKWLYLKLRTSYGKNGNQGIGRYASLSKMATTAYVYGANTAVGIYPSSLANSDLGWETTTSLNIGLDYGFLNRRISGSIDVYKAKTTDVLVQRSLPVTTGYTGVMTNLGGISNSGIELELTTINLNGRFGWETNFVFSLNRDKITKLWGGENDKDIGNSFFVGKPISAIYDYEMAGGVWTEQELYSGKIMDGWYPGQFKYVDQNTDGKIDPTNDRVIVGYKTPSYRFSINNTLSYKNLSLSFFINSIQGGKKYYLLDNAVVLNADWDSDKVYRTNTSAVRPYWTPDNGVNNATGIYNSPAVKSGIYQSRSFVRLQDVSVNYKLGPSLLNALHLSECQFYIASKNPYVWTKWSNWDPETGISTLPMMRNIIAGIRFTL